MPGAYVPSNSMSAGSNALPRLRTLGTHAKHPRSLNVSPLVEGRSWWPGARADLAEVRVCAGDGRYNGEKMVRCSANVDARQRVRNGAFRVLPWSHSPNVTVAEMW